MAVKTPVKTDKPPTNAELEAGMKKAVEAVEKLDGDTPPTVVSDPTPPVTPETPLAPPVEPAPAPELPPPPQPEPAEDLELKKRLANSAREAQVLRARTKKMDDAVDRAAQIPEPTEEEMAKEFSDWDVMDETAKRLAKDSVINSRRFQYITEAAREGKNIEDWHTKVDQYLEDPQTLINTPALEGKQEDFKVFATKPTRRGLDFEDLVKAFLYDVTVSVKPKAKGSMLEIGSGGPNAKPTPKSDKISITEARALMKSDYKKYKELLLADKIEYE